MSAAENPNVDEFTFMVESFKATSETWVLGLWQNGMYMLGTLFRIQESLIQGQDMTEITLLSQN